MPSLLKSKTVKARKPHGCRTCNATAIQPGEEYQRDTYIYDGRVYDWVQCAACSTLGGLVYEWAGYPEDGIGRDEYVEWAREVCREETLAGECARWYLSRIGEIVTQPSASDSTNHENGSQ